MYFIHICEPVSKGDAQKWDKCSENQMSELFITFTVYRLTMSHSQGTVSEDYAFICKKWFDLRNTT